MPEQLKIFTFDNREYPPCGDILLESSCLLVILSPISMSSSEVGEGKKNVRVILAYFISCLTKGRQLEEWVGGEWDGLGQLGVNGTIWKRIKKYLNV